MASGFTSATQTASDRGAPGLDQGDAVRFQCPAEGIANRQQRRRGKRRAGGFFPVRLFQVYGQVKIKAPIATEAGLGPFRVQVRAESPLHLSGTLKPAAVEGTVEVGGRKFKYSADPEFKIDVVLEPKPRSRVEEPVKATRMQPEKVPAINPTNTEGLGQIIANVALMLVGTAMLLYDPFRNIIFIVDKGGKSEKDSSRCFHHEFSSLLLKSHSFFLNL